MAAKRRPIASNGAFNVVGHFDFRDVDAAFRSLERAGQAHRALKDLRGPVRRDLVRHAKAQTGPGGHWKPRAPSTVKRARRSKNRRRVKGPNRKLLNSLPRRSVEITTTGDRGLSRFSLMKAPCMQRFSDRAGSASASR